MNLADVRARVVLVTVEWFKVVTSKAVLVDEIKLTFTVIQGGKDVPETDAETDDIPF